MKNMNRQRLSLLSIVCLGLAVPVQAGPSPEAWLVDEESEESEESEPADEYLLLRGGDVFTGTGEVLRGADLLAKNGVIEAVGYDFFVPDEAEVVDVRGLRLYPGMVALSASSRITEGAFAPADAVDEPGYDPALDVAIDDEWDFDALDSLDDLAPGDAASRTADTFDPFSSYLILTLAAGITTVEQSNSAVKLRRYTIDDVLLREGYLTTLSFGSPDARRNLRESFADARAYLEAMRLWREGGEEGDEPSKRGINASVLSVLQGEARGKFNADDRDELLAIARLAQEYGFRPVIEGCREGWIVADELGRAGATAILTARDRAWKDPLQVAEGGSSIENAAKLHGAGVQVAIKPLSGSIDLGGIAGRDLLALPIEAAFAVRGGLSNQAALEAITIVPARILGVDHRIGTLEVGKDADVLVTDGDLLHYETFVQYAVVSGRLVYDKAEELFYAHIRPRPVQAEEPADEGADGEVEAADQAPEHESGDGDHDDGDPEDGDSEDGDPEDGDPEDGAGQG